MASICSIECSWLLRRSRAGFQSKISFLIRKCAHFVVSAHISLQVKHRFVKDRNKASFCQLLRHVVLATNKTCGTYPWQVFNPVVCVVEHHVLKMTFHHNFKMNLFHISTNIPAFFTGTLAGQRAQRPISCLQWYRQPSHLSSVSMILLDVLLLLDCWLKEIYFHRYVDLSLSQQVLRFSVLVQAPQKCLRCTSLPLQNCHLNVFWLSCNFFLSHFCLFFFVTSFRTTWISSILVKMTIPFCPCLFIDKLSKAATFSSQKGRTTYDCHLLQCMIYT